MGDKTGIEWAQATWNPLVGCTHVSAGCDHCYAAREASGRLSGLPAYQGLAVAGRFTGEVRLLHEKLDQPIRWRKPRRVFVNSMSDLFHDGVPDEYIAKVFAIMARAHWHQYQVLTKRPGRMSSLLGGDQWPYLLADAMDKFSRDRGEDIGVRLMYRTQLTGGSMLPLRNVWLGTSVEDQKWANVRIPQLLRTPAAVRFLSMEPLLSAVDLGPWLAVDRAAPVVGLGSRGIDWVIVGGESGPGARPMHPDWARDLRDQCLAARVPFFMKQLGAFQRAPNGRDFIRAGGHNGDPAGWPEDLRVRQYPNDTREEVPA